MNPQRRFGDDMRAKRPQSSVRRAVLAQPANQPVSRPQMPLEKIVPRQKRPESNRSRESLRWLVVAAVVVLVVAVPAWFLLSHKQTKSTAGTGSQAAVVGGTSSPSSIRLLATGDFIAHDSVNAAALQSDGTYNYVPLMNDFLPILKQADIRFCNDPILNGGKQFGITGYPKFNSPTEFVTDMGKLGCNLVNTASNHSFDFTQANIDSSVQAWATIPNMLAVAGENRSQGEHDAVHYFTVKGVKFAFLAYTTYSNTDSPAADNYGVNIFSQNFAKTQIQEAKQNGAQFIIASMRWGTEYSTNVNAEQKADAQFLADQGVGLVLGHGSHELQPVQQLTGSGGNKTTVWYSLGNFINTQEPPETLFNGLAVITVDIKTKQVTAMSYLPIYMHYEWTAAQAAADNTNSRNHLHLYLLEDATQSMVDAQQLKTTIDAQRQRITNTLTANGLTVPLITSKQYLSQN
jgi:poly-gamma-glutamate capsule biosynthesis protein CapA/YwtB (metallophosphatase superfamily)